MGKRILLIILMLNVMFINVPLVDAADKDGKRNSILYEESRYELMTYAEDSWWDVAGKTGTATATAIKNFFWMTNLVLGHIVLMIVYQLFSLDIIALTKETVQEITSSTAGSLLSNFGLFAFAVAAFGIVIRAYIQQNWQAFLKIVGLVLLSMVLLSSIQSEKFNYIDLAHGISTTMENAIMQTNPSLTQESTFEFQNFDDNTALDISIAIENKVFDALIYKPYLLLQYGTTDTAVIREEDPERITAYLEADPATESGMEKREEIAKQEFEKYNNTHIFAGNAFKQTGYIFVMILSTTIQGIVFFSIALIRILLQFAFIVMMLMVPFILFVSLFPSFEALVGRFTRGTFLVMVFKGITMFFVLVATSFITLGYDMTDSSDDLYYRIFIQIIFSVAIIFMYTKRQFVFNMLEGASPTLQAMGAGEGTARNSIKKGKRMWDRHRRNQAYKGLNQQQRIGKKQRGARGEVVGFDALSSNANINKRYNKRQKTKTAEDSIGSVPRQNSDAFPTNREIAAGVEREQEDRSRTVSASQSQKKTASPDGKAIRTPGRRPGNFTRQSSTEHQKDKPLTNDHVPTKKSDAPRSKEPIDSKPEMTSRAKTIRIKKQSAVNGRDPYNYQQEQINHPEAQAHNEKEQTPRKPKNNRQLKGKEEGLLHQRSLFYGKDDER